MDYNTTFIKAEIMKQFKSVKKFADVSGIPYTTIVSILNKGIGGTAVETVVKICNALNISIAKFQEDMPVLKDEYYIALTDYYLRLNGTGRKEAVKRIEELSLLERYATKQEESSLEENGSVLLKTAAYDGEGIEFHKVDLEKYEKALQTVEKILQKQRK